MRKTWMTDGSAWMAEGIRHAQLVGTLNVPYVYRAGLSDNVPPGNESVQRQAKRTVHAALP